MLFAPAVYPDSASAPPPVPDSVSGSMPAIGVSATLHISSGWNMVSAPFYSISASDLASSCGTDPYAWRLSSGGYVKETILTPGYGYWIKGTRTCDYPVSASALPPYGVASLFAGWNLVGSTSSTQAIANYSGDCQITSGPWHYNTATNAYDYSPTLKPGEANWIKVPSSCTLSGNEQPPVPPTPPTNGNQPPSISSVSLPSSASAGQAVTLTVNAYDPEGGQLSYLFSWGDGASNSAGPTSLSPITIQHTYSSPGTYAVALTVTDNQGASAQQSAYITVSSGTPVLSAEPSIGPSNAGVVVTEFADFQCPYCGIVHGKSTGGSQYDALRGTEEKIISNYANTGKIKFAYHIMAFLGQESIDAANAALCVRESAGDTGFFAMHDKLFDEQQGEDSGTFSVSNLKQYATEIGYGNQQVLSCIGSGKYDSQVSQSTTDANNMGVQGTPTFMVNGVQAASADYATVKAAIDTALGSSGGSGQCDGYTNVQIGQTINAGGYGVRLQDVTADGTHSAMVSILNNSLEYTIDEVKVAPGTKYVYSNAGNGVAVELCWSASTSSAKLKAYSTSAAATPQCTGYTLLHTGNTIDRGAYQAKLTDVITDSGTGADVAIFNIMDSTGRSVNNFSLVEGGTQMFSENGATYVNMGVCQIARGANGASWARFMMSVSGSLNNPPVISGGSYPTSLNVSQTGTWTVYASDPEGGQLTYSVNWGDSASTNAQANVAQVASSGQASTFTHSYSSAGTYTVTFTVTDNQGASAQSSTTVTVSTSTLQSQSLIIRQSGEYYLKMNWYEAASRVTLSMTQPSVKQIGSFIGTYPPMPAPMDLGYMTAGTEVVFSHTASWHGGNYGPVTSKDPTAYQIEDLGNSHWRLTFDDGIHYDSGYNDGQFEIYLQAPPTNITVSACKSGTTTITAQPLGNPNGTGPFERLGLDISSHPEITSYRIQWFDGSWSDWYTPGQNDIDSKANLDGTQRRVWSYFDDHVHQYQYCLDYGPAPTNTNQPPVISSIGYPATIAAGASGTLVVNAYDPEGSSISYHVFWGDGNTDDRASGSSPQYFTHSYSYAGTYGIQVSVSDGQNSVLSNTNVVVTQANANKPPVINGGSSPTGLKAGDVGTWTVSASDPEGSQLSYLFSWGDGASNQAGPTSLSPITIQHTYSAAGTYTVQFTVTDSQGATAQKTSTVSVTAQTNQPPVINGVSAPSQLTVGQSGTWSVSASDPEGRQLTYSYAWGDGSTATASASPSAAHTYSQPGAYTATITVTDDQGAAAQSSAQTSVSAVPSDRTPPSVSATPSINGGVVTITASASDNGGIYSLDIYEGQYSAVSLVKSCGSASSCSWTTGLNPGTYYYYATAKDNSGNTASTPASATFTINPVVVVQADNTPPSLSATAVSASGTVYTITATASDSSGISGITIYSAQGSLSNHNGFFSKSCSSSPCVFETGGSSQYVYYATATDASAQHNTATTDLAAFTVPS